ncbi:protein mesh-like [Amphiura filiformis]|uniref:protein mesh-like n=1 Tax=Amphiura filiformis TaxID=82378 RepID=UPI003B224EC5
MRILCMFVWLCSFLESNEAILFSHGHANGDTVIPVNDDGSSDEILLSTRFPFFDTEYDSLFVNTNGVVSFIDPVRQYTPDAFPLSDNRPLIAPFWADVNTREGGTNSYREVVRTSASEAIFQDMDTIIRSQFVDQSAFSGISMFIATWDQVAFFGTSNPSIVNTFQAVLVTNGRHSFVLYNYEMINWTTGTASDGDSSTGLGGTPAQAGFNAGDGIRFFSISGSRTSAIVDIETTTNIGTPGRWLFRVDTATIQNSGCNTAGNLAIYPFVGSMLGGDILRVSGPCFDMGVTYDIKCKFNSNVVIAGEVESSNRARCVLPNSVFFLTGRIPVELSIDGGTNYDFQGTYNLVSVDQIDQKVFRVNGDSWHTQTHPSIMWLQDVFDAGDKVNIEVVGYHENGGTPTLETISKISTSPIQYSDSMFSIDRATLLFLIRFSNLPEHDVGFIKVSKDSVGTPISSLPTLWSDMHSLHWLFQYADSSSCNIWVSAERGSAFLQDTSSCPCTLDQALVDTARFGPLPSCNMDTAPSCNDRPGAIHCVRALQPSASGGGQECCYDNANNILNAAASSGGGFAHRNHHTGVAPYDTADRVPYLSHFLNDVEPWMRCCVFTSTCVGYIDVRPSQTCDGYIEPQAAGGGGDPHILTLDGTSYTFNGRGEYVLVSNSADDFILQGRTSMLPEADAFVTVFSAVAARLGSSDIIHVEVNERRTLDVWVKEQGQDWRWLDFDELTWWSLNGVWVSGRNIPERGVLVIFTGGVSLELKASNGIMSVLLLAPESFKDNTRGLFGTWNDNPDDDFLSPNGETIAADASLAVIHNGFGQLWQIDAVDSIFYYSQGMGPSYYRYDSFTPIFSFPMNPDVSDEEAAALCGDNQWCLFDYHATGDADIAMASRDALEEQMAVLEASEDVVICSTLESPSNGELIVTRSSVGGVANYACVDGYVIMGLSQRVCQEDGTWFGDAPVCAEVVVGPSMFMFEMSAYTALESDQSVAVKILRTGDISTEGRIRITTTYTESASSATDFDNLDTIVTFPPDIEEREIQILIKNDDIREPLENFEAHLHSPQGSEIAMPNMATIFIQDDEIEYSFREIEYIVSESTRTVRLTVQKVGYLEESSVDFLVTAGTATSPSDFISRTNSVTFEAGQMQSYIDIDIINDNDYEDSEQFMVILQSDILGQIGHRNTAVVNIENDDDLCNQPCENEGRCIGVETCMCSPEYYGDFCQNENCPSGCENGGTCMDYRTCKCVEDYTGDRCETNTCSPPCQNGGICYEGNICICPQNFEDGRCEKFACSPSCLNGGGCTAGNTCICRAGYTGNRCQMEEGETSGSCSALPIGSCDGPNLQCIDTSSGYLCQCAHGYYEIGPRQCLLASRIVRIEILIDEIGGVYQTFRDEYNNPTSTHFLELANTIRNVLLDIMRPSIAGFQDVRIVRFSPGSIKVEFDVMIQEASTSGAERVLQVLEDATNPVSLTLIGSTIRINPFRTRVVYEICPLDFCQNGGTCLPNAVTAVSTCQCASTFLGNQCEQVLEEDLRNEGLSSRDIVGIIFGVIMIPVMAGFIILMFCWYIRRRRSMLAVPITATISPNWSLGNPLANMYEMTDISRSQYALPSMYNGSGLQAASPYFGRSSYWR